MSAVLQEMALEVFPLPQEGSWENRAQHDHRVVLRGQAGCLGLPSSFISRKALFHLYPLLLPTGNKQLSTQFHPPVCSPPNAPWFKFQSPLTVTCNQLLENLPEKANYNIKEWVTFQFPEPAHRAPEPNLPETRITQPPDFLV